MSGERLHHRRIEFADAAAFVSEHHRHHTVKGRSWDCKSRPRTDKHLIEDKLLWERPA